MNICHVITRLIIGGAQENTILTCRGLTEKGHHVTLVAGPETGPEGSLWNQARAAGCRIVTIDALRRAVHPWRDLHARSALRTLFAQDRPDVVHTHSSKAGIVARSAAAIARAPLIVHTIHGMSFNRTQNAATRWIYRALERRAARHTDAFIAVADAMIDQSVAAGLAPRERFVTIRSGMETDRYRPDPAIRSRVRAEWGVGERDVVVGTVARLFKHKGYEDILAAMPRVAANADLRFVWIGDGANRSDYEAALQRIGLRDRVRLLGLLPPDAVAAAINGFDLLVHASRWEGLPRAVVQALLTEVPAISFDNDGAPEVVIPGRTGRLVPYGDIHGLASTIAQLAADPAERQRLGRQGRTHCLVEFDWRRMVDQIEALYLRSMAPS